MSFWSWLYDVSVSRLSTEDLHARRGLPLSPGEGALLQLLRRQEEEPRDPHWQALQHRWLKEHPYCRSCGTTDHLQVHHKIPVSWNKSRELDVTNLITLCPVHHLWDGHLGDWKSYNELVEQDCDRRLFQVKARPYRTKVS